MTEIEELRGLIQELHGRQTVHSLALELLIGYSEGARETLLSIDPEGFEALLISRPMSDVALQAAVGQLRSLQALARGEAGR